MKGLEYIGDYDGILTKGFQMRSPQGYQNSLVPVLGYIQGIDNIPDAISKFEVFPRSDHVTPFIYAHAIIGTISMAGGMLLLFCYLL